MDEERAREFLRRLNELEKEFGLTTGDGWRVSQNAHPWWNAQVTTLDGQWILLADRTAMCKE